MKRNYDDARVSAVKDTQIKARSSLESEHLLTFHSGSTAFTVNTVAFAQFLQYRRQLRPNPDVTYTLQLDHGINECI